MMAGTYVIRKSSNNKYYFTLKAENSETVLTSETYNSKQGALNGISSVKENSPIDARYKRKVSARGLPYFVLVAANGEVIGVSEEYSSTFAMDNGISAVKRIGLNAITNDLS